MTHFLDGERPEHIRFHATRFCPVWTSDRKDALIIEQLLRHIHAWHGIHTLDETPRTRVAVFPVEGFRPYPRRLYGRRMAEMENHLAARRQMPPDTRQAGPLLRGSDEGLKRGRRRHDKRKVPRQIKGAHVRLRQVNPLLDLGWQVHELRVAFLKHVGG
jgi:hypothetical protein